MIFKLNFLVRIMFPIKYQLNTGFHCRIYFFLYSYIQVSILLLYYNNNSSYNSMAQSIPFWVNDAEDGNGNSVCKPVCKNWTQ